MAFAHDRLQAGLGSQVKLHERDLAYLAEVPVNWCPELGTVLANEEVVDGRSEVGGFPVIRKPMRQWMLRITAYAERLLNDYPEYWEAFWTKPGHIGFDAPQLVDDDLIEHAFKSKTDRDRR